MRLFVTVVLFIFCCSQAEARGGFSSSGGKGGFSSSARSSSRSAPSRTVTTTITRSNSYASHGYYARGYHPYMMGGFGMGYGYSNGLIEGLIIGNLMHPAGTTVYSGGGYNGQALLYPDGRVVDQNGYQVGTYNNGQYMAQQGGMVAQAAPQQPATPVVISSPGPSALNVLYVILIVLLVTLIIGALACL